jgi:hypothetical protein
LKKEKFSFFISNSAQDFFSRLASRATIQNLEIGLVRSLSIITTTFVIDFFSAIFAIKVLQR